MDNKVILTVDEALCRGCGVCMRVCPTGAIQLVNGVARIDAAKCESCKNCMAACPFGAIRVLEGEEQPSSFAAPEYEGPAWGFGRGWGRGRGSGFGRGGGYGRRWWAYSEQRPEVGSRPVAASPQPSGGTQGSQTELDALKEQLRTLQEALLEINKRLEKLTGKK